jgi:hypothetical protein
MGIPLGMNQTSVTNSVLILVHPPVPFHSMSPSPLRNEHCSSQWRQVVTVCPPVEEYRAQHRQRQGCPSHRIERDQHEFDALEARTSPMATSSEDVVCCRYSTLTLQNLDEYFLCTVALLLRFQLLSVPIARFARPIPELMFHP